MTDKNHLSRILFFVVLSLLILFFTPLALTEKGHDITSWCTIRVDGAKKNGSKVLDRKYMAKWERYSAKPSTIMISLPQGITEGGIYLCFAIEPQLLEIFIGKDLQPFYSEEGDSFAHRYVPFANCESLRVQISGHLGTGFSLSEIYVTSGEEPPDWVQIWQPRLEKADMLVLVAHPDDEFLWMGGTLPYYASQRQLSVAVAYLTCANPLRRSEMLNGLWTAGVRNYPYIANFRDKRMSSLKKSYDIWGGPVKVEEYIAELYRKMKPQVVLSHDLFGEYGHPAHVICANEAVNALVSAANENNFPDSFQKYGSWDVPKLYLHLYEKHQIVMDWAKPLTAFGGKTSIEVTEEAFSMHRSQKSRFNVSVKGAYSCSRFGLVRSLVGADMDKDDFFENINFAANFTAKE